MRLITKHQRCSLIALDVDGTLIQTDGSLSERAYSALQLIMSSQCHVVLVTGKQYSTVEGLIRKLGLQDPQITSGGALITIPGTGKIIYNKPISPHLAEGVIDIADSLGVTIVVARDGNTYVKELNRDTEYMAKYDEYPIVISDFTTVLSPPPTHLMAICYGNDALYEQMLRECKNRLGSHLGIRRTSPYYIEFVDKDVSKGNSLCWVCEYLGIPNTAVIAVGDSYNDISMFQYAGYSVAMSHSSEEVKGFADEIIGVLDSDGIAGFLENLVVNDLFYSV